MRPSPLSLLLVSGGSLVLSAPSSRRDDAPIVTLTAGPKGTVRGSSSPLVDLFPLPFDYGGIETFKGIPYAQPPVGPLRLKPPVPLDPATDVGEIDATTSFPAACPQQLNNANVDIPNVPGLATDVVEDLLSSTLISRIAPLAGQEDCLTINVERPKGVQAGDNLPVLLWIFGGGFELGSTTMYSGSNVIQKSIQLGKPVVFVAVNYRVAGFGFLGGKEILADGSANLGLLDQRLGMQWVADNIRDFGGDPDRVTLWGESAGAISIFNQLVALNGDNTYKGKPLFHGAIMNSGSAVPTDPVDSPKPQAVYDRVVANAGCSGQADTLNCLRGLDFDTYLNASNDVPFLLSFSSLALSYLPRPDNTFLTASPDTLGLAGSFARVPYILGDQQDEGTLFGLFSTNLTTTADVVAYLRQLYFSNPAADIDGLVALYPDNPIDGSPFGTGTDNSISPQFKRVSALLGDAVFTLTRRGVLNITAAVAPDVRTYSYIGVYDAGTPVLGTAHGTDIFQVFYGIKDNFAAKGTMAYFLNFAYNLDPNDSRGGVAPRARDGDELKSGDLPIWPVWSEGKGLVQFGADEFELTTDDFREAAAEFLLANLDTLRF